MKDTLEFLNLGGNKISKLPPDFSSLKSLKILFFAGNDFEEIPSVLGRMNSLRMLSFKSNKIKIIPEDSLNSNLVWLILTDNQIKSIPTSIGKLSSLRKLMLSGNLLTTIPRELSNCRQLELIRLASNKLSDIPRWLLNLPRLSWLAISGNPIPATEYTPETSLPEININDIELHEKLGEGASGIIYKARVKCNPTIPACPGDEVAIKLFKGAVTSDGLPADEIKVAVAVGEHPNLIRVLARVHGSAQPALMLSLVDTSFQSLGGPPSFDTVTRDVYPENKRFAVLFLIRVLRGVAAAALHMCRRGILHGDLYAHNIMVDQLGHALLGDFGAATVYDPHSDIATGLRMLEVRAFGCLLEEMLLRVDPTEAKAVPKTLSALTTLMQSCTQRQAARRPTFDKIVMFLDELSSLPTADLKLPDNGASSNSLGIVGFSPTYVALSGIVILCAVTYFACRRK